MDTQLVATQMRHRSWMEDYARQQESGLSVKEWCHENGIRPKTFYYRVRALREDACNLMKAEPDGHAVKQEPEFIRVGLPNNSERSTGISIKLNSTEIRNSPDANNEHVRMVLEAIANA